MSPEEDKTCAEGKPFISPAHNVCFCENLSSSYFILYLFTWISQDVLKKIHGYRFFK